MLATDLQRIAEPVGRYESGIRKGALDERIGRRRGPMHQVGNLIEGNACRLD